MRAAQYTASTKHKRDREGRESRLLGCVTCLSGLLCGCVPSMWSDEMTFRQQKGGCLFIANLQKTPYDSKAQLRVFARTDDVMKHIMQELKIEVPKYDREQDPIKYPRAHPPEIAGCKTSDM